MSDVIRSIKEDIQFDRYKLDEHIERIGCMLHYWSNESMLAENEVAHAKIAMDRMENREYIRIKEEADKITDGAAKAKALTSEAYTDLEDTYLEAVKRRNELRTAVDLITDAVNRMKEEVKLYCAGYYTLECSGKAGKAKRDA